MVPLNPKSLIYTSAFVTVDYMATVPSTAETDQVVEFEDYIDQQIDKTSFHVRTVDLVTGLILLSLVVLGSLLAIVIVDHWILGLSFGARLTSLIVILASSLFILVKRVIPPLFRSINPEYAAQTVERSFPSLTNALVNFLFFRDRPQQIRESVYDGLRHQAATGLAAVQIDAAVDCDQREVDRQAGWKGRDVVVTRREGQAFDHERAGASELAGHATTVGIEHADAALVVPPLQHGRGRDCETLQFGALEA